MSLTTNDCIKDEKKNKFYSFYSFRRCFEFKFNFEPFIRLVYNSNPIPHKTPPQADRGKWC